MSKNSLIVKKSGKEDRTHKVLIGLVEYYLKTGKPVGSHTLKEAGFGNLSSATIRNYFADLEKEGFLSQQHSSGGRIPTPKAYRAYVNHYLDQPQRLTPSIENILLDLKSVETREIAAYLQNAAEKLCSLSQLAVFLSAPRFDQDYIVDIKLVPIDSQRCLCVIITDFGVIRTETLQIDAKISSFTAKRIESYFHWRLTGHDKSEHFDPEEEKLAQRLYNELVVRYIVGYSNFIDAELYRTGLSKLLSYSEFLDPTSLTTSLALFENAHNIQLIVKESCKRNRLTVWINDDLTPYTASPPQCTVMAIPYFIHQKVVGAIGILGPMRMPYRELFAILEGFSNSISESLTRSLYKYKITFRYPQTRTAEIPQQDYRLLLIT